MLPALLLLTATTVTEAPLGPLLDLPDATPLDDRALSSKLQAALKRRAEAVAVARPKIEALIAEANSKGVASGPIASWIRSWFKQEPKHGFLLMLNGQLSIGLVVPKTWVEPPAARPACNAAIKKAVANQGEDKISICDQFYNDDLDECALTLFHEAQHLRSIDDCESSLGIPLPPEKRLCAGNFEAMLKFLWKGK